jgi:TonB family protein
MEGESLAKIAEHSAIIPTVHTQGLKEVYVLLRLTITKGGALTQAGIAQSSGVTDLDSALLGAASQAAPFPPLPSLIDSKSVTVILPVGFRRRA